MKKWIMGAVVAIATLVGISASEAVKRVGASGQCDTSISGCFSIPLQTTVLCGPGAGCPALSAPGYIDGVVNTNRWWGGTGAACRTSTDGGTTWANCTTQPLNSGSQEFYAGSSDGGVIATGDLAGTCTIKKSIDNGANWSTVYSNASLPGCGGALSGGTRLKCLSDSRCDFVFVNSTTTFPNVLHSSNDGQTWALTANGGIGTTAYLSMAWDGTTGVVSANTFRPEYYASGTWAEGVAYTGCGLISGSMIYNGIGYGICRDTVANEKFKLVDPVTGVPFKTVTLPGVIQTGVPALGYSVATNNLYMIAPLNTAPASAIGVFVSRDDGASFVNIFTSSQGINSMTNRGDITGAGGCIYFSVLGGGPTMFAKIC